MDTTSTNASHQPEKRQPGKWLLITLALLSMASLANLFYRIDCLPAEVSLRIECANLILNGKTPYVDFFVLDSPMALFITCIPVKLAGLLKCSNGYQIASCALVFEWIVSVLSLLLTAELLLRYRWLKEAIWCQTVLLTLAFLNIACVYQFGQIEHFLMLGLIPYIFARWLEYCGKRLKLWEALLCGLAAGLVVLLDPCYWIAPVVLEVVFIAHFKRVPTRLVSSLPVLAITSASAFAAINGLGSAMMQGYHSYIWPFILADRRFFDMYLYGINSCPDARIFIYLLIVTTVLAFAIRKRSSIVTPLVVSGWLGFSYVIALCKGFFFQALPMFWCASLALAVLGVSLLFELRRYCPASFSKFLRPRATVLIVLGATICGSLLTEQYQQQLTLTAADRHKYPLPRVVLDFPNEIETKTRKFDQVLVLSNNVAPLYPIATLKQRTPASRIMWSFHFPILNQMKLHEQETPPAERKRLLEFYNKILMEDIEKNHPVIIMYDQTEAAANIADSDIGKLIRRHYNPGVETQFASDNLPPREYASPNFPLTVEMFGM